MATLCNLNITAAVTASVQTAVSGFGAPQALSLHAVFTYQASSATSVTAYVQTTIDGVHWVDVACFQFTTASDTKYVNLSGMTSVNTPTATTEGSMTANTSANGILGDQYRVKVTSVGTYGAATTLAIYAVGR